MVRILAFLVCLFPVSAFANVMNPDLIADQETFPFIEVYEEDGITATSDGVALLGGFELLGPDGITGYAGKITFTMERRFNAISADLSGHVGRYCFPGSEAPPDSPECENYFDPFFIMTATGYRLGEPVAEVSFLGPEFSEEGFMFGGEFWGLQKLVIETNFHPYFDCHDNCVDGRVSNITLSPIPLPAALPMFGAALIGLGFVRRFLRKS